MEEVRFRQQVWEANVERITQHNAEGHSWRMDVNMFADLTPVEFQMNYVHGGFDDYENQRRSHVQFRNSFRWMNNATLPTSVDWTTKGAVTAVKKSGSVRKLLGVFDDGISGGSVFSGQWDAGFTFRATVGGLLGKRGKSGM